MNKIRLILLTICGTLVISSCAKEKICTMVSLSIAEGIAVTYEYDDQNRISRINQYDPQNGNILLAHYSISRNEDGKISSIDYRNASGIAVNYYALTYNSNGYLGTIYTFENNQGDFIADELYSNTIFYYGGDAKVDSTVMFFGLNKRSTSLTWTGDNITSISHQFNDVLQYSRTFVYDNLNNAFGNVAEVHQATLFSIGEPNIQSFSKNNIIEESHYDAGWNLIGTYNYTFAESSSGNIEVVNGNVFLDYLCE